MPNPPGCPRLQMKCHESRGCVLRRRGGADDDGHRIRHLHGLQFLRFQTTRRCLPSPIGCPLAGRHRPYRSPLASRETARHTLTAAVRHRNRHHRGRVRCPRDPTVRPRRRRLRDRHGRDACRRDGLDASDGVERRRRHDRLLRLVLDAGPRRHHRLIHAAGWRGLRLHPTAPSTDGRSRRDPLRRPACAQRFVRHPSGSAAGDRGLPRGLCRHVRGRRVGPGDVVRGPHPAHHRGGPAVHRQTRSDLERLRRRVRQRNGTVLHFAFLRCVFLRCVEAAVARGSVAGPNRPPAVGCRRRIRRGPARCAGPAVRPLPDRPEPLAGLGLQAVVAGWPGPRKPSLRQEVSGRASRPRFPNRNERRGQASQHAAFAAGGQTREALTESEEGQRAWRRVWHPESLPDRPRDLSSVRVPTS